MRNINTAVLSSLIGLAMIGSYMTPVAQAAPQPVREWTFLIYLNGHNNLDSYGAMDINEMEKVGSTDSINVVVQWASLSNGHTRRLLVRKDNDPQHVTSPTVQDIGVADMGDYRSLTSFVQWGVDNYPARHYFVDIWDHGSGWHKKLGHMSNKDISWDDNTGHFITTKQLGQALTDSAKIIGHKVDLYGSDACLMAMAEVAGEVSDSVQYFAGSEETEPGEGWPYDALLKRWTVKPTSNGGEIGTILTQEYVKSYQGGSQGTSGATFSTFDLTHMDQLIASIQSFGSKLSTLNAGDRSKVVSAMTSTQSFAYSDYGDLMDFLSLVENSQVASLGSDVFASVRDAVGQFVVANADTSEYAKAKGVSIWLPSSKGGYDEYSGAYSDLKFAAASNWGSALRYLLQDSQ